MWIPPSQTSTKVGLWGARALTGVDLLVAAHAIGIHDALEAGREAGGADERGGHVPAGDAVNHSTHTFLTLGRPAGRPADRQTDRQADETDGGTLRDPWIPPARPRWRRGAQRWLTGQALGTWGSPSPLCEVGPPVPPAPIQGDLGRARGQRDHSCLGNRSMLLLIQVAQEGAPLAILSTH